VFVFFVIEVQIGGCREVTQFRKPPQTAKTGASGRSISAMKSSDEYDWSILWTESRCENAAAVKTQRF
jgi:hypothetical protein